VAIWKQAVEAAGVDIRSGTRLTGLAREGDHFRATTTQGELQATRVILAIGRRGSPRKLGVPGEDLPHVAYSLKEADAFAGLPVLVVGGGDSALEAACALAEVDGTTVHLSYRGEHFNRAKPKNVAKLEAVIAAGKLTPHLGSQVTRIDKATATLTTPEGEQTVPAAQILIFAGGDPPLPLLTSIGVTMERKFGTA
jgi:thioredoxin reductase